VDRDFATTWSSATTDSTTRVPRPSSSAPARARTIHEVRIRGTRAANADWTTIRQARIEVRDAAAAVLWSTEVSMPPPPQYRDADVPVPAVPGASAVRIVDLADGGAASLAEVYVMGEVDAGGPSHWAPVDARFEGKAVLAGRVTRADGSGIYNATVSLAASGQHEDTHSTASGDYIYPVLPPGTYSLTATHPQGGVTVTVPSLTLPADQETVQDLVFPAFGTLQGFFTAANQPVNGQASHGQRWASNSTRRPTYVLPDPPERTVTATDSRSSGR
jgi:hypothetical protein